MNHRIRIGFCFGIAVATASLAAAPDFPDRGRAGVVDAAHVLLDADREALNRKVVAWDRATGHQLVIATVPNMQGLDVKDYGYRLGRAWALGDKQRKDGVILLLAMAERKVRIEVGYGLEPNLTDAATSQIIRERIVPRLRAGDIPQALNDGADAIMAAVPPAPAPTKFVATDRSRVGAGEILTVVSIVLALLGWIGCWIIRDRRRDRWERDEAKRIEASADGRASTDLSGKSEFHYSPPRSLEREWAMRQSRPAPTETRATEIARPSPTVIVAAPAYEPPRRSHDDSSSSSSSWGSSDSSSSSSSYDSSSSSDSSSGFDSGGGSFGGGGSDSSW